jgi:hypothetical protein
MIEARSGKIPTTSVRRRISLLRRSSELLLQRWRQCSFGKPVKASRSAGGAPERAEVDHPALLRPGEGVGFASGSRAIADDLAGLVHRLGVARRATERAEVDHPALPRPGEGMSGDIPDDLAPADHLAAVVHRTCEAVGAPEGGEVDRPRDTSLFGSG